MSRDCTIDFVVWYHYTASKMWISLLS